MLFRSKDGDTLNIDVTVIKDGYHGDTSRMFHVGKVPVWAGTLRILGLQSILGQCL